MDNYKDHVIALCKRKDLQYRDLLEMVLEFTNSELDILDKEEGVDNNTESSNDNNDIIKTKGSIYSFLSSIGIEYLTINNQKFKLDQFDSNGITDIYGVIIHDEYKTLWNSNHIEVTLSTEQKKNINKYILSIKDWRKIDKKTNIYFIPNTNCICIFYGGVICITNRIKKESISSYNKTQDIIVWELVSRGTYGVLNRERYSIEIPLIIDNYDFASENPIVNEMIAYTNG